MESEIVGRIEHVTGHTQDIVYDLVFMTDRLLALIIKHPADAPYRYGLMDFFVGGRMAHREDETKKRKLADDRRLSYQQCLPDELVAKNKRNFEISFEAITSATIHRGFFYPRLKINLRRRDSRETTLRFGLPKNSVALAQDLINRLLASKVKVGR